MPSFILPYVECPQYYLLSKIMENMQRIYGTNGKL